MTEAIILVGIPGSGKSTLYKKLFENSHLRINLDMLRRRSREQIIFKAAVKSQTKIVIDNTNIGLEQRQKYIPLLKKYNYKIIAYYFLPNINLAVQHNLQRIRRVPTKVIKDYAKKLTVPSYNEGFAELYLVMGDQIRRY